MTISLKEEVALPLKEMRPSGRGKLKIYCRELEAACSMLTANSVEDISAFLVVASNLLALLCLLLLEEIICT